MSEELILDNSLQRIKFAFRLTGFNVFNKKRSVKQNAIFIFDFLWHVTDIISAIFWVLSGIVNGKNLTELTIVIPCVVHGILAEIKVILFILKENNVHTIIDNIRDLETKSEDFENFESNNLIRREKTILNYVKTLLNVLNSLMVIVFVIFPPVFISVKYITTGQLELVLPFLDVYPFDSTDLRFWPFAYAHQFWSVCLSLLYFIAIDYFFFTCCIHIRAQFKLLQHQFQEITVTRSQSAVDAIDHLAVQAKLKQLIMWHQKIISTANMLEEIYTESTFFHFSASALIICMTGFNVTTADDKALVVSFIVFLFMSLLQVFFVCLFGDMLISSSMQVADAISNSKWYLCDVKMRKSMLLVLTRAQTPCKLTAADFSYVNLRSYMKIISTSWSYFALLQTIYSTRT